MTFCNTTNEGVAYHPYDVQSEHSDVYYGIMFSLETPISIDTKINKVPTFLVFGFYYFTSLEGGMDPVLH